MLEKSELLEVKGGFNWVAVGVGGAIAAFLIGLFDGYVNPVACRR